MPTSRPDLDGTVTTPPADTRPAPSGVAALAASRTLDDLVPAAPSPCGRCAEGHELEAEPEPHPAVPTAFVRPVGVTVVPVEDHRWNSPPMLRALPSLVDLTLNGVSSSALWPLDGIDVSRGLTIHAGPCPCRGGASAGCADAPTATAEPRPGCAPATPGVSDTPTPTAPVSDTKEPRP